MNKKGEYDDRELRAAFSSLTRLNAPQRALRGLSERIEKEKETESRKRRTPAPAPQPRVRGKVLIAVFATLLFAVPVTYWTTKRFAPVPQDPGTYVVRFVYEDEDAMSVSLLGDFNNWRKNEIVLERVENSTLWVAEVTLQEGLYKYGFLVNGTYIVSDPLSGLKVKDSLGNESSLVVLSGARVNGGSL